MKVLTIAAAAATFYGASFADIEISLSSSVGETPDCDMLYMAETVSTSASAFECEARNAVNVIQNIRFNVSAN